MAEIMFQNVANRATVYRTGVFLKPKYFLVEVLPSHIPKIPFKIKISSWTLIKLNLFDFLVQWVAVFFLNYLYHYQTKTV